MRAVGFVYRGPSLVWPAAMAALSTSILVFVTELPTITVAAIMGAAALLTALSFAFIAHGAFARAALRRGRSSRRAPPAAITADARGLFIGDELVLPRHAIASAHVRDDAGGGHTVVVEGRWLRGPCFLRVESPRIAQALADSLASEEQALARFDALPPWAHRMRWLAIALTTSPWIIFNVLRHLPSIALFFVLGLYALIALPMVLMQRIAVGHDGVFLEWAGRRRFLPYGVLRDVRPTPLGVELELATGKRLELRLTHRDGAESTRAYALLERIRNEMAEHRRMPPPEDQDLLARGPRSFDAWVRDMQALGDDDAGYRSLSLPRSRLWAVLENSAAAPSAREGAALALQARLDEAERERLAAIAEKTASPRLRVAFDAVATGSPDRLRIEHEEVAADATRAASGR